MLWDEKSRKNKVDIADEDWEDRYGQRYEETHNFSRAVYGDNFGAAWHGRLQTNKDSNVLWEPQKGSKFLYVWTLDPQYQVV